MAGLFPGICNSQNIDRNGQPLANSVLSVFIGGTPTLASCFQDIALTIPAQNPMTADQTSRLPIFYVNDGVYHLRLVDPTGVQIYDYPQVASIGASSGGGGGGGGVDPTTIFQTGDELWRKIGGARTGWVRQNGRTIGSATSGASERANADVQALFLYIWNNYPDSICPVVGGRGANAATDWAANKQITLPNMRGRAAFGVDGMGNLRANVIPDGNVANGLTADTDAASGGEANHTLTAAEQAPHTHIIPAHTHNYSGVTGNDSPDHTHQIPFGVTATSSPTSRLVGASDSSGHLITTQGADERHIHSYAGTTDGGTQGNTDNGTVGGGAHNNMPPFALGTWYIKL